MQRVVDMTCVRPENNSEGDIICDVGNPLPANRRVRIHIPSFLVFFQASFLEGILPSFPQKNLQFPSPQTAAKLCALNLFSAGTVNYKYITETFF